MQRSVQRKPIDDCKLRCSDFGEPLLAIEQVYVLNLGILILASASLQRRWLYWQ
jgi:hypothetical protein